MSTRTTGKRKMLDLVGRMQKRDHTGKSTSNGKRYYTRQDHVRAELNRLARQVRKLRENRSHMQCDYTWALKDVLDLIAEARR